MGIPPTVATLILREHKQKPIVGELLLIGRQSIMLTADEAIELLRREGVPLRPDYVRNPDTTTTSHRAGVDGISDRTFFSMFTDARVMALDVSDYEGAEIVHDLCVELPDKFRNIADFIFNGSCLDNLFDPARAIRSISKMLRPGGRNMNVEHGTPCSGALICYSPEWFFDFFAVNNYSDCQTLVCKFGKSSLGDWRVYWWRPYFLIGGKLRMSYPSFKEDFVTVSLAEKGPHSTDDKTPIQGGYRVAHDPTADTHYVKCYHAYLRSSRTFGFDRGFDQVFSQPRNLRSPEFLLGLFAKIGFDIKRGGAWGYEISKSSANREYNQVTAPYVGTLRGIRGAPRTA
jgi:SAM-dependent methyltransferase